MGYMNAANPHTPTGMPLIHDMHGEAYKVTKAVYMALPFLWERLGAIYGAVASTVSVRGQVAVTNEPDQIQLIPFPANISIKQVADYTCWVATLDGKRRYKYQNSYLTPQGLVLRLDHQAPEMQKGMPFLWVIELTNKPWGHGPHGHGWFARPFGDEGQTPPPFNWRPAPGVLPPAFVAQIPGPRRECPPPFPPMPPHPDACPPWDRSVPPTPDGSIPYIPVPPMPMSNPDVDEPGLVMPECPVNPVPAPPVPPSWAGLL